MELSKIFLERRSVNFFQKNIEISKKELKLIVESAALSPSSSNTQPWELVVVSDNKIKETLKKFCFNQEKITDCSAVLVLLGNPDAYKSDNPAYKSFVDNGYIKQEDLSKYIEMIENIYANLETPISYAVKNASLFAMSLMYSAKNYGWDTHPMIGFEPDKIKQFLKIPDKYKIVMLICIGKFDNTKKLLNRNNRKSFEDICHFNFFEEKEKIKFNNKFLNQNTVTLKNKNLVLTLNGELPELEETALDFEVLDNNLNIVSLNNLLNKPLVISSVPSLDTPVCKIQTKKIDDFFFKHREKINYVTISCDTPFAQVKYKENENIKMPIYSDYLTKNFSLKYGLLINELNLCARSLILIDMNKKIKYFQLVNEISEEPEYDSLIKAVAKL